MKKILQRLSAALLAGVLAFSLAACGDPTNPSTGGSTAGGTEGSQPSTSSEGTTTEDKIVNVGMTYSITSMNPILIDASESMKYAVGLAYLPLVEIGSDNTFQGVLAKEFTTNEDGTVFTVTLDENAKWSDGQPLTVDDVIYTILKQTSKSVSNVSMSGYGNLKGFDESGQVADDATEVEGLKKIDEQTMEFHASVPMSLETFSYNFLCYIFPIPQHEFEGKTAAEMATSDYFLAPTVVSGPFRTISADVAHNVSYVKNENYYKGAPIIDKLNILIRTSSQLYSGLASGEIDFVQQTTGVFAVEDIPSIETLSNAKAVYGDPVTSVLTFINNESVPDKRVRQAILYAINRPLLVEQFLNGKGEVVDGFQTSASPYFDPTLEVIQYDPDKAKALLADAGWDGSQTLIFKIDSGDGTYAQAANVIVAQLAEVGINVQLQTVNFNQLLTDANNHDFDMMAVQYTIAPTAPALDIQWLTYAEGWPLYNNPEVDALVNEAALISNDQAKLTEIYGKINRWMQEDVPIFSSYVLSPLGAVSNRLVGATPSVYGSFHNVEKWDVQ